MQFKKHTLTITGLVLMSTFAIGGCGSNVETPPAGAVPVETTPEGKPVASGGPAAQQGVPRPGENKVPQGDAPKEKEAAEDVAAKPKE